VANDNVNEVILKYTLDTADAHKKVKALQDALKELAKTVDKLDEVFERFGKAIRSVKPHFQELARFASAIDRVFKGLRRFNSEQVFTSMKGSMRGLNKLITAASTRLNNFGTKLITITNNWKTWNNVLKATATYMRIIDRALKNISAHSGFTTKARNLTFNTAVGKNANVGNVYSKNVVNPPRPPKKPTFIDSFSENMGRGYEAFTRTTKGLVKGLFAFTGAATLAMYWTSQFVGILKQYYSTIIGFYKESLEVYSKFELLENSVRQFATSAEDASRILNDLYAISSKVSGLTYEGAVQGYVELASVGMKENEIKRTIAAVSNMLSFMGKPASEAEGVFYALRQVLSDTKIMADDIRQIGERIPGLRDIISKKFGTLTIKDLNKMGITPKMFAKGLVEAMEEFGQASSKVTDFIENLTSAFTKFQAEFGKAVWEKYGEQLVQIMDAFTKFVTSPAMKYFAKLMLNAIGLNLPEGKADNIMASFFAGVITLTEKIVAILEQIRDGIIKFVSALAQKFGIDLGLSWRGHLNDTGADDRNAYLNSSLGEAYQKLALVNPALAWIAMMRAKNVANEASKTMPFDKLLNEMSKIFPDINQESFRVWMANKYPEETIASMFNGTTTEGKHSKLAEQFLRMMSQANMGDATIKALPEDFQDDGSVPKNIKSIRDDMGELVDLNRQLLELERKSLGFGDWGSVGPTMEDRMRAKYGVNRFGGSAAIRLQQLVREMVITTGI